METGTGPDQRIGPNDPAKAIRETERAVQPTVRPVILPRRLRLWRFHAKRRGPYRHQYLPDPEYSSPVESLGEIPPSPTKIFNSQFSIFNSPVSPRPGDPHREYQGWYRPQAGPAGHRRGFQAVLTLIEPLYRHSSYVLGFLPTSEAIPVQTSPEQALFNALPMMFCRRQAVEEAAKNGIPEKTLDSSPQTDAGEGNTDQDRTGRVRFLLACVCVRDARRNEGMKEMPLLSSPVSTTVAALRQYWRCLMPVPASPLAYTDGWRCLLSRTTQVTEDQLHLQGGEARCLGR